MCIVWNFLIYLYEHSKTDRKACLCQAFLSSFAMIADSSCILCLPAMSLVQIKCYILLKAEETIVSSVVSVLSFWATLNPSITTRIPIASIRSYLIFAGNTCFTEINNENIMDHCSFFCPFYINHCVVSPSSCS